MHIEAEKGTSLPLGSGKFTHQLIVDDGTRRIFEADFKAMCNLQCLVETNDLEDDSCGTFSIYTHRFSMKTFSFSLLCTNITMLYRSKHFPFIEKFHPPCCNIILDGRWDSSLPIIKKSIEFQIPFILLKVGNPVLVIFSIFLKKSVASRGIFRENAPAS